MVPRAGLEPAQEFPLPPQDSVSTNSTTSARKEVYAKQRRLASFFLRSGEIFWFCHSLWLLCLHSVVKIQPFSPVFPLAGSTSKAFCRLFLWNFKEKHQPFSMAQPIFSARIRARPVSCSLRKGVGYMVVLDGSSWEGPYPYGKGEEKTVCFGNQFSRLCRYFACNCLRLLK